MKILRAVADRFHRLGCLVRAAAWAVLLGIIETISSRRGRQWLALATLLGLGTWFFASRPVQSVAPGEVGVRIGRLTGGVTEHHEGWVLVLPGLQELRRYPLRDQVYRPEHSRSAGGRAPYQSVEGLSIGVDVAVRYALEARRIRTVALGLPADVRRELIEPVVDGVLHRTFARHTVREIFSSKREAIERAVAQELSARLARDGILVREVFLGNVDLPGEYRRGLEGLLGEELQAEKMRYTLELKEKAVKQSELEALAEKVRHEKAAEAQGQEQIIAARAQAEAMKHVLPFKEKEIEQKRLEAEAAKVHRIRLAEASAEARRIEALGESDSRRKLAEAEAYRMDLVGKAQSEQLARDSRLIAQNPLLIQKTLADKLADNIQVIVAPPGQGGLFPQGLLPPASAQPMPAGSEEEAP